jgi:hypothetical protein
MKRKMEDNSGGLAEITEGMKGVEYLTGVLRAMPNELAGSPPVERTELIRYALQSIVSELDVNRMRVRDGLNKAVRERDRLIAELNDNGGDDGEAGVPDCGRDSKILVTG